jgi:hypothetical protein
LVLITLFSNKINSDPTNLSFAYTTVQPFDGCPRFVLMDDSSNCVEIHIENSTCSETGGSYNEI